MERSDLFMGVMIAIMIFLSVTLYMAIAGSGGTESSDLWTFSVNDSAPWSGMYVGDDGTLYTTSGNTIEAIATDGTIRWQLAVNYMPVITYGDSNGCDRVFLSVSRRDGGNTWGTELLALRTDGSVIWRLPLEDMGSMDFTVAGDRLYRYANSYVTAYDCDNGSVLWKEKTRYWHAIDAKGNVYIGHEEYRDGQFYEDLRSYDHDGTLRWVHPFSDYGINYWDSSWGRFWVTDGTLLITDGNALTVIDSDGRPLQHRNVSKGMEWSGSDIAGRTYFISWNRSDTVNRNSYPDIEIISPDGSEKKLDGWTLVAAMGEYRALSGGVAYFAKADPVKPDRTQDDLVTYELYAYDLFDERVLWTNRIKIDPMTAIMNASGFDGIMSDFMDQYWVSKDNNVTLVYNYGRFDPETPGLKNRSTIRVLACGNVVYVSYWAYNYVYPARFDQTTYTYGGGICALDGRGNLIWSRPTDSYVSSMTVKNGTVYYRTINGRFSAASMDVAAGFVLAAAYLFFRFFLLGAVSRARTRLDKNANRMSVLDFILRNPGSTLYDIAKGRGMNIGTVRYHLLILSVNHRIKACEDRGKHVRYFVNRGEYSDEDMLILSLLRREHMSKLLYILASSPGVQNVDISRATGMHDSAVSRYMRELADRGVVDKKRTDNGRLSYVLDDRYREAIANVGMPGDISGTIKPASSCRTAAFAAGPDD